MYVCIEFVPHTGAPKAAKCDGLLYIKSISIHFSEIKKYTNSTILCTEFTVTFSQVHVYKIVAKAL